MDIYGKKFVFLGDSITEGCGVADKANIFTNRLASEYHLEKALNYGIGGTRIARQTGADICAAAYCDRFAFGIASRQDFTALMNEITGEDLVPLMTDYLDTLM